MQEIKCKGCARVIKGGHYNTPRGPFCVKCWEKTPAQVKNMDLIKVLTSLKQAYDILMPWQK